MSQIDSTRFFNAGTKRAGGLACSRQGVSTGGEKATHIADSENRERGVWPGPAVRAEWKPPIG